ncbi:MAG: pyridoxal phosphate-dependent aminotransferase [Muribaculum sp.]|nr:pyridoxal phosphate-dependent aminotransferase [Muribaculum sp.]
MIRYDFDTIVDRHNSECVKYDRLLTDFGRDGLLPLWVADMDFAVEPTITDALRQRVEHRVYGYPLVPDRFWRSIIDWVDRRHGFAIEPEALTYVPGIVRAIGLAINYYTDTGDKILIQPPVYHPFAALTTGNGRVVVNNPLMQDSDGNYHIDIDSFERTVATEHPRMMILCNPHNPGGRQWSAETLQKIAAIARRHDMIVISDEIHADLMLWGGKHTPFLSVSDDAREVGIMFGAPSKTFNIPGLVSSWAVIPNPKLRDGFYQWLTVNELNVPTMMAIEGTVAAYNNGEQWLDQAIAYIEGNIRTAEDLLSQRIPAIKALRPDASFLIWLDCRGLGLDHDSLISLFIDRAGLALNDGAMFGEQGSGFMRLNVATSRAMVTTALNRLADALAQSRN